jgi:hypothetical protein
VLIDCVHIDNDDDINVEHIDNDDDINVEHVVEVDI